MRRREFIAGLGAAPFWPAAVRAQQRAPTVGYLSSERPEAFRELLAAFKRGMSDVGYVDGRNVTFEYRWADSHNDQLPKLAAQLVRLPVDVIVTVGTPGALAAKAATSTIPIVFLNGSDPVQIGLVSSLPRPNNNLTGITNIAAGLTAKRLELLHRAVPAATSIALLINPASPTIATGTVTEGQAAARALGINLLIVNGSNGDEIVAVVSSLVEQRAGALLVSADPFYMTQIERLVALTAHYRIPAGYEFRVFAEAGGLMSYGTDILKDHHDIGVITGRVLRGEKPADLPVQQTTKLELVLNAKTAKALGLTIPETLLATADEVIE